MRYVTIANAISRTGYSTTTRLMLILEGDNSMNDKFKFLSGVRNLLAVAGWLVVIAGLALAVYGGIIEPSQVGHHFGTEDAIELDAIGLGIGLVLAIGGLVSVAFSEVIGVLLAIEENTRTGPQ